VVKSPTVRRCSQWRLSTERAASAGLLPFQSDFPSFSSLPRANKWKATVEMNENFRSCSFLAVAAGRGACCDASFMCCFSCFTCLAAQWVGVGGGRQWVDVAFPLAVAFPAHCCSRLDVCFFFVLWWGGGFFGVDCSWSR